MKSIIVAVHATQPGYYDGPDAARITMTEELQARIEQMTGLCRYGNVSLCAAFMSYVPEWLTESDESKEEGDAGDYTEAETRIGTCRLVVFNDGAFSWVAVEKHSRAEFETDLMYLSYFEED